MEDIEAVFDRLLVSSAPENLERYRLVREAFAAEKARADALEVHFNNAREERREAEARIQELKKRLGENSPSVDPRIPGERKTDYEMLRDRFLRLEKRNKELVRRAEAAEKDQAEMHELSDLQHRRTVKAAKLWQKAHNKPDTIPGLGGLIEWLLERAEAAEAKAAELRGHLRVVVNACRSFAFTADRELTLAEQDRVANAIDAIPQSIYGD